MIKFTINGVDYSLEEFLDKIEEDYLNEQITFEQKRSILLEVREADKEARRVYNQVVHELNNKLKEAL